MFEVAGAYGYTSDIPKIPMQGCPYLWGFLDSICSYAPTLFLLALSGTLHSPMFYHIYLYTTIQRPREKKLFLYSILFIIMFMCSYSRILPSPTPLCFFIHFPRNSCLYYTIFRFLRFFLRKRYHQFLTNITLAINFTTLPTSQD